MAYKLPKDYQDKSSDELFEMLEGKQLLGEFIHKKHKLVVSELKKDQVILDITKKDGSKAVGYVPLIDLDEWLEVCRFKEAVDG